jgi:hypothetical protein
MSTDEQMKQLSKQLDAMDRSAMTSDAGRQAIAELTALARTDASCPMIVLDRSRGRGGPVFIAITDAARRHLVAAKLDEFLPDVFAYPAGDQRDAADEVIRFQHGLPSGDPAVRPLHAKTEKTAPLPGDPTLMRIGPGGDIDPTANMAAAKAVMDTLTTPDSEDWTVVPDGQVVHITAMRETKNGDQVQVHVRGGEAPLEAFKARVESLPPGHDLGLVTVVIGADSDANGAGAFLTWMTRQADKQKFSLVSVISPLTAAKAARMAEAQVKDRS